MGTSRFLAKCECSCGRLFFFVSLQPKIKAKKPKKIKTEFRTENKHVFAVYGTAGSDTTLVLLVHMHTELVI